MARFKPEQAEKDAVHIAAALMAVGARTAPKARGIDATDSLILDGDDLEELAAAMERKAKGKTPEMSSIFARDADSVRNSSAVLVIGVKGYPKKMNNPLDCGACGYPTCKQLDNAKKKTRDFTGPVCIFQAMDLGIALGSAVKLAGLLNIDNRMMYTVGAGAKEMGLLDSDVIIGIPLSVSGKSPYFDRK